MAATTVTRSVRACSTSMKAEGRVNARGEDLTGSQILGRVGLSSDRYELSR